LIYSPPSNTDRLSLPEAEPAPRGGLGDALLDLAHAVNLPGRALARLALSQAKHRSLAGHPRWALRLSRLLPFYDYPDDRFFRADGAPDDIEGRRRAGFARLAAEVRERHPNSLEFARALAASVSDVEFINAYRVPFQFRNRVRDELGVVTVADHSAGPQLRDLDGQWSYDLGGSYGVNLFGSDFYKGCIERGVERAKQLGLVLGPYHPVVADNVARLQALSGLDEVSFHMSGTEAVMQAVRLARYHTGRSHVVRFAGAYHGWWDGVQAGPGNPRPAHEVYTLQELDPRTLAVLDRRRDIACVLVNPLQALNPNGTPPGDAALVASDRKASYHKHAYTAWLVQLREVCSRRGIALIFDEVFLGFRLAVGGAQEYFGVRADLVTYGKTLGGGLPVGALCGRHRWMRRFRDDRPSDICFARGTFNSHPYVMATMNEFLRHLDQPAVRAAYVGLEAQWDARAAALNELLARAGVPVRVANMVSVFTTLYTQPSRYNWMLQFYLRARGLSLSWVGTGRYIFSHDLTDADYATICARFVDAAAAMQADGWWWDQSPSDRQLKRSVLDEVLAARFPFWRRRAP